MAEPRFPQLEGAALEFLAKEFGGPIAAQGRVVVIDNVVVTEAVGGNGDRVALSMFNLGTDSIFVDPIGNPSSARGIRLAPSGGGVSLDVREDLVLSTYRWLGLAITAPQTLYVIEVFRIIPERLLQRVGS